MKQEQILKRRALLCLWIIGYSFLGASCAVWGIEWWIDDTNPWMLGLCCFASAHWFICAFQKGKLL